MQRLLAAAAAIDLVEALPGDRWTLGQRGAALSSNPGALAMIEHHKLFYTDLADPVAMLRRGRGGGDLAAFWSYAEAAGRGEPAATAAEDEATRAYSALMAASQPMVAEQVLDSFDFSRHRSLLDIGGGHGAFVREVATRHPGLQLALFDLPPVAARAREILAAQSLPHIVAHGGSFRDDPIPGGADLITLVRILHDHDDAVVLALLKAVRAALPPGGTLLIAEPMAGTRGAEAMGDAYFGLYLWAMGSGRPRTAAAYTEMLQAAGFARVHERRTGLPMVTRLLVASI
jgi:demethylspheroidene O-methyltransferase